MSDDKDKVMFNEGQETEAEQILRERKRALINLFKHINLKPRKGNTMNGKLNQDDLELLTQRPSASKQAQAGSSGNGEDDDGEGDISEEQINLIYKKYALYALSLDTVRVLRLLKGAGERQQNRRNGTC